MTIQEIKHIDGKHIAIMDTSSISFLQLLHDKGVKEDGILKDYDLILIPKWVIIEIEDAPGRIKYVQGLIELGYPIFAIAEESYSDLAECEEGNLYQIVLASTKLLGRVRAYLRRFVEKSDPLDMEAYCEWIKRLYDEWPISGEQLSNGRIKKKNAGEVSITILAEVISWYYPGTEELTIYSQDFDTYEFQHTAEKVLRDIFAKKSPVPVSYKSNDAILCQLVRQGAIDADDVVCYRTDNRRITYSKEMVDYSVILVTEQVNNELFIELVRDSSVHIIF